ncbi:MAG: GlsB/YeaQ/YmgE family stress response membrane protein, partial [Bdellovibrionota bacterium]
MGIIGTLIIGFVIGLVARFLKPGKDPMGFFMTS